MLKKTALKNAFHLFTPHKKRELIEYIETAKQEKTKLSRLEKIKPMIMKNIGLNDKYK
ncbi:YdeI/OmpD-associated family protein [Flavobacterium jumunjinense]|uniref:YdeI/OmpD-associated family protein n=1 Tax=Flavobacterium jumunjinense TaxID=998845 RepID=A0ABV5GMR7_9FLAO